ncbi:PLDc N-terminal domain-containing protein [Flavobacterium sp.]|uniref:PLDc N-terminal domain-containing protein n=1 Tax=Flavobacterium sp. TaxID=239 RepID=UPI002B4B6B34|nr:PLDc N-terminal domain-containing protein [Flavobacterium sp.]HLP65595.1 PLDc N-terminal domain-containing protein [Flavobacterium sp.]
MNDKLKITFFAYLILTIIGAFMKLSHIDSSSIVMSIGIASLVVFIFLSLSEIYKSTRIDGTEKFMWTVGMLLLSFFAGIAYLIWGRKRIIAPSLKY